MNRVKLLNLLVIVSVLTIGAVGCKKKPDKGITNIPNSRTTVTNPDKSSLTSIPSSPDRSPVFSPDNSSTTTKSIPEFAPGEPIPAATGDLSNFTHDPNTFKNNTVFFAYDQATVNAKERMKIDEVASFLKSSSGSSASMLVEGHCDERGTEEYNRALGERRALAVREYLVRSGVAPERVYTRSFGEDRPSMQGHDEAAWSKNRRDEFVVLRPK